MKTITSTQNQYIKELKQLKNKKGRKSGRFIAESEKCAQEAILYADVESILVTREDSPSAIAAEAKGIDVYLVSDAVMEAVSDIKTPQTALAVVRTEEHSLPEAKGLFVALEDLSDPQNVGTIIRTADAAGVSAVILSAGTCDYTSPKAVRAAMGSIFHIPIVVCEDLYQTLEELQQKGVRVVGTHLNGKATLEKHENTCIIIGNEARGMTDRAAELADSLYKIPMLGKAESLNAGVAAGIVIYQHIL